MNHAQPHPPKIRRPALRLAAICIAAATGCQTVPSAPTQHILDAQFGHARVQVAASVTEDPADRRYLLDRMALAILTLADGYPTAAQPLFEDIYRVLRTQGINRDKTVEAVVLNEDVKFWKGEPFEQALAMLYYSLQQGQLGLWDNARAAASGALFRLKDFGDDDQGERINTLEIARRALRYEQQMAAEQQATPTAPQTESDYLNSGYAVRDSNFALGYLMSAVANLQLARRPEALDHLAVAVDIDPALQPICDRLRAGDYNTVLVVAFGLGPQKIGYGPDRALAAFRPRFISQDQPLTVRVGDQVPQSFPIVCDVNAMAADHMWNNLEDVRLAKSNIGSALLIAGLTATDIGHHNRSKDTKIAGYGAIAAGMFLKAGAHADTRHCRVLPQRFYLVPLNLPEHGATIELQVDGQPQSRILIPGLGPPSPAQPAQLRYVQLVSQPAHGTPYTAPPWALSGRIFYANDQTGPTTGPQFPYILGGHCVRTPTHAAITAYHASGYLNAWTANDLAERYRQEGIALDALPARQSAQLHLLEGGPSLATPLVGTTGFVRLFGQQHPPYHPRTGRDDQRHPAHTEP